jgi:hypothetical protein
MAFYSTANLVLSTQTTATVRESPTEKFQIQDFESTFVTHPSPNNLAFASCQPLVTGPQDKLDGSSGSNEPIPCVPLQREAVLANQPV